MRGSSRGSAKAVQAAFDTALAGDPAWETLAEELFAVTGVVDGSASLRRALADPSREASQIARLRDLAEKAKLDPDFAEKFLNFIVKEVIRHHEAIRAGK